MKARGGTLVELLVGLAVAGSVTAIVVTALGAAGVAARRHERAVRSEDAAWQALAVMVEDLRTSRAWRVCTEARDCPAPLRSRPYRAYLLHTDAADWLLAGSLKRCVTTCEPFMDDVLSFDVLADMADDTGRVRRVPLLQWHADGARLVEVSITLGDGRRFSRVAAKRSSP